MTTEDKRRYLNALHAVQSAIAFRMSASDPKVRMDLTPKHLRVGIDSGHIGIAALTELLIAKGVFTADEYEAALADACEREVALHEKAAADVYGSGVIKFR